MTRRSCGTLFAVAALTLAPGFAAVRPHLIVFISDDHAALDSTPYGATDVRTPNLQRPTLIEIAGGQQPPGLDGRSFAAVLRGERRAHRETILATHSGDGRMNIYPMRSLRTQRWKYIRNLHPEFAYTTHIDQGTGQGIDYWQSWVDASRGEPRAAEAVRRYHERPGEELYDVSADPFEQHNLAADGRQAERLRAMRLECAREFEAQGDGFKVFNVPRLLADPASYAPGAGAREAKASAGPKAPAAGKR